MRPVIFTIALIALTACSAAAAAPDPIALGGRTFTVQCGGCHSITEAGSNALGPRLSEIYTRAKAAPEPATWLRSAITSPNAEVAPGYQAGLMPISYNQGLSSNEIDALVTYMLEKGAP
ncbi:MAG: cytochrome c [Oscillochloris sp.]|nr:cytochrome c [Oscillochloris sp.]